MLHFLIQLNKNYEIAARPFSVLHHLKIDIDTRTVLNIENCKGNPKMQVLFPLIRTLNVDPNDIFYPERLKQNSKRNDLHLLVDTCSEQEAAALIAIIDSILKVMRNQGPTNLQK